MGKYVYSKEIKISNNSPKEERFTIDGFEVKEGNYLVGFDMFNFEYSSGDHHVKKIALKITSKIVNKNTISVSVTGEMNDNSDNYMSGGTVRINIVAFPESERIDLSEEEIIMLAMQNFNLAYYDDDHHVMRYSAGVFFNNNDVFSDSNNTQIRDNSNSIGYGEAGGAFIKVPKSVFNEIKNAEHKLVYWFELGINNDDHHIAHTGIDVSTDTSVINQMFDLSDKHYNNVNYGNYAANSVSVLDGKNRHCMVARYHSGDENDFSEAKFAKLALSDEAREAGFVDAWLEFTRAIQVQESNSSVVCKTSPCEVITRRLHGGDENGITYYEFMKVVVSKRLPSGSTMENSVIKIDNIQEITGKEHVNGWVECENKVIIGRTHNGDEEDPTTTSFANIYVVDDNGAKYQLKLEDVILTGLSTERGSDFFINSGYANANTLSAWYEPVTVKIMRPLDVEHTSVSSADPNDSFACAGGTAHDNLLVKYPVDRYAYDIVNSIRGDGGWGWGEGDSIGIHYGLDGVCHQMANRFLQPSGKTIARNSNGHPKGYCLSYFLYGEHGDDYTDWLQDKYMVKFLKYHSTEDENMPKEVNTSASSGEARIYYEEKIANALSQSTTVFLRNNGVSVQESPIAKEQRECVKRRAEIMRKYGFLSDENKRQLPVALDENSIREMVDELNAEGHKIQMAMKNKLDPDDYKRLFGDDDVVYNLVNYETALRFYLPKK